jgi:hypothetical protein
MSSEPIATTTAAPEAEKGLLIAVLTIVLLGVAAMLFMQ